MRRASSRMQCCPLHHSLDSSSKMVGAEAVDEPRVANQAPAVTYGRLKGSPSSSVNGACAPILCFSSAARGVLQRPGRAREGRRPCRSPLLAPAVFRRAGAFHMPIRQGSRRFPGPAGLPVQTPPTRLREGVAPSIRQFIHPPGSASRRISYGNLPGVCTTRYAHCAAAAAVVSCCAARKLPPRHPVLFSRRFLQDTSDPGPSSPAMPLAI